MTYSLARNQALSQVSSIVEMVAALQCDYSRLAALRGDIRIGIQLDPDEAEELAALEKAAGDCEDEDMARERITEDPLSVEVRSDWVSPGEEMTASEFRVVLCTGGPHVELVGDLDEHHEPTRVRVLYRSWSESGELVDFDLGAVLAYCSCLYFGG